MANESVIAVLRNEPGDKLELLYYIDKVGGTVVSEQYSLELLRRDGSKYIYLKREEFIDLLRQGLTHLGLDPQQFNPILTKLSRANIVK